MIRLVLVMIYETLGLHCVDVCRLCVVYMCTCLLHQVLCLLVHILCVNQLSCVYVVKRAALQTVSYDIVNVIISLTLLRFS